MLSHFVKIMSCQELFHEQTPQIRLIVRILSGVNVKISRFHNISGSWINGPYFPKNIFDFVRICLCFACCHNYGSSKFVPWTSPQQTTGNEYFFGERFQNQEQRILGVWWAQKCQPIGGPESWDMKGFSFWDGSMISPFFCRKMVMNKRVTVRKKWTFRKFQKSF